MQTQDFTIEIPRHIQTAVERLESAGFEAYLVGGCVRDALLGETPDDYDITTAAKPEQIRALFEKDYDIIDNGMKHGTITPIIEHKPVEITTFRIDGSYSDNRHPDAVTFSGSLTDDLSRRDFTVNAMAYSRTRGLVDCFGGQADLQQGIIRALRFAAVLGFAVEEATGESIRRRIETIKNVSVERIYTELKKLLDGDYSDKVLAAFPCFLHTLFGISLSEKKLRALSKNQGYAYKLAVIFEGEDPEALRSLKPDNKTMQYVRELLRLYALPLSEGLTDSRGMARFIFENHIDDDLLTNLLLLHADLDEDFDFSAFYDSFMGAAAAALPLSVKDLAADGNDLMEAGITGRQIKKTLDRLVIAVIEGKCENEKESLMEYLKKGE